MTLRAIRKSATSKEQSRDDRSRADEACVSVFMMPELKSHTAVHSRSSADTPDPAICDHLATGQRRTSSSG
jgi:hypothetical protein